MTDKELLQFPTDYPIKVVGHAGTDLRVRIDTIMARHVPTSDLTTATERRSGQGKYIAISYSIVARGKPQIIALVEELGAAHGVIMVL